MTCRSMSYSAWALYDQCPKSFEEQKIKRSCKRESSAALDRGNAIHKAIEHYIWHGEWECEVEPELPEYIKEQLDVLAFSFDDKITEQTWRFDWQFMPDEEGPIWVIADYVALYNNGRNAIVIDHKTGKRWGNEVKHSQQARVLALATFAMFPQVKEVNVQFLYFDDKSMGPIKKYRRDRDLARIRNDWLKKFSDACNKEHYHTKPGWWCKYCPYLECLDRDRDYQPK